MIPKKTVIGRDAAAPRPRTLRFESLEDRLLLSVTAEEQQFVYLLNLARHDPVAYQREAGLAVDLSGIVPRPPLAVNDRLMQSAGMRSEEMAEHDYLGHQSLVTGVWPNELARDQGYALPSSWPDDNNFIESIAAGNWYDQAAASLDALIVDQGLPATTHRRHLLGVDEFYAENREIGVGYATDPDSTYGRYWAVHIARQENMDVFLTGVVFGDGNGSGRYDAGEGLPGVTVQAVGRSVTTNDAGGFSIAVPPNGSYRISASGAGLAVPVTANVLMAGANVEVDILSGVGGAYLDFASEPTSAWTNPRDRLDVSDNQVVDPLDALQVISRLNTIGPGNLFPPDATEQVLPPFLDTDGDGQVMPHDVLLVVNDLNRTPDSAEGEGTAELNETLPVPLEPPPLTSPLAAEAHRAAISGQPVADRGAVPRADLPTPALESSPHDRGAGSAPGRRFAQNDVAPGMLQEKLAAWWATEDLLDWELLASLGLRSPLPVRLPSSGPVLG